MGEIRTVEQVGFEKAGDQVKGVLEGFAETTVQGVQYRAWIIKDGTRRVKVRERSQMVGLLTDGDVGKPVKITYKGEVKSLAGRPVKQFEVEVG